MAKKTRTRPADNKALVYGSLVFFALTYFWLDLSGRYLMGLSNNLRFIIALPLPLIGARIGYLGMQRIRSDIRLVPIIGLVLCSFDVLFILWGFTIFNLS
jgi:hypothetical protein